MTISINIPNDLQKVVDQKMAQGGYSTPAEFILDSLYASIENDLEEEALDAAWESEIGHRVERIKNGTAVLRTPEEVYSEAAKFLAQHQNAAA